MSIYNLLWVLLCTSCACFAMSWIDLGIKIWKGQVGWSELHSPLLKILLAMQVLSMGVNFMIMWFLLK